MAEIVDAVAMIMMTDVAVEVTLTMLGVVGRLGSREVFGDAVNTNKTLIHGHLLCNISVYFV